jgi:TPR repeat protein
MMANLVNSACDALDSGDDDLAIELLEMPAELGVEGARFNIAIAYKRRGDLDKAIRWYQAAAEAGDADAMAYLGWMFQLLGDFDKASDWYGRARASGHLAAGQALQNLHRDNSDAAAMAIRVSRAAMAKGHALNGRTDLAVESWMVAAGAGDPESMYRLGQSAEVRHDRGEAILWHSAAARANHDLAKEWLDENWGNRPAPEVTKAPPNQHVNTPQVGPTAECNNGHPMDPRTPRCQECGARLRMQWMGGNS